MVKSICSSCDIVQCPCEACKRRRRLSASSPESENKTRISDQDYRQGEETFKRRQASGQLKNLRDWKYGGQPETFNERVISSLPGMSFGEWKQSEASSHGQSFGNDERFRDYRPTAYQIPKYRPTMDAMDDKFDDYRFRPNYKTENTTSSLGFFFREVISIITYFAVLTVCLWVTLVTFGINYLKTIPGMNKRVRIIALVIVALMILTLFYGTDSQCKKPVKNSKKSSVKSKSKFLPSWGMKTQPTPTPKKWTVPKNQNPLKIQGNKTPCKTAEEDWKFWADWIPGRTTTGWFASLCRLKNKWSKPSEESCLSDQWAKEVMRQSKFYAIPMEMKMPPQILVYLRDTFFG